MEKRTNSDATREGEKRTCRWIAVLAVSLVLLPGCASLGKAKLEPPKPAPVADQPSPPLPAGPFVTRLADGREGYVITEPSAMDAQARSDFEEANGLIKQAKYDKAIELLEKVIARAPGKSAPHINIAIAYRQVDKPEQAEEHLKKALELVPGHPVASNEYGLLLRQAGRFAESRQIYEKSLAVFPKYHPIHKNLAILCDLYLRDFVCAIEHYEIYDKAMPQDQQVKLWIADLNARTEKTMTALTRTESSQPTSKP